MSAWISNTDNIRTFITAREEHNRDHYKTYFGLSGSYTLTLNVNDLSMGNLRTVSLNLDNILTSTATGWRGVYFSGVPIWITAVPRPGYRFVSWSGASTSTSPVITLTPGSDISLTALFEPATGLTPTPHDLANSAYVFTNWLSTTAAGTYPPAMRFQQVIASAAEPTLSVDMDSAWTLPYSLTSRSRINGEGLNGVSFINTSNQNVGGGYMGAATLWLNTLGQTNVCVTWTGGTVLPNVINYAIRLQYRVGGVGSFSDVLDGNSNPIEYLRNSTPGHTQLFGPISLPSAMLNQPSVELRWRYYFAGGATSGARAQLRLDDITVYASETACTVPTATPTPTPTQAATSTPTQTQTPTPTQAATSTPTQTQTPTPTQPATSTPNPSGILDNFNRAGPALGSSWVSGNNGPTIVNNQLQGGDNVGAYWQQTYGSDQWVSAKLVQASGCFDVRLLLKAVGNTHANGLVTINYAKCAGDELRIYTFNPTLNNWSPFNAAIVPLQAGDVISARAQADHVVSVYHNGTLVVSDTLATINAGFDVGRAGQIGLWPSGSNVVLDDFDGGTFVPSGPTPTPTQTQTPTPTQAVTSTPTQTQTPTPTQAVTSTPTQTQTPTPTQAATSTPTQTQTPTPTQAATSTPTQTQTPTPTQAVTSTPTQTQTPTPTQAATSTPTQTQTPTPTQAVTSTPTQTQTPTPTQAATSTPTQTQTPTPTQAVTSTPTPTPTGTCSFPQTGILDTFNRANGPVGNGWVGETGGFAIQSNQLRGPVDMSMYRPTTYGASQEAYVKLISALTVDQEFGLHLKAINNFWSNGVIEVTYRQGLGLRVYTFNGSAWQQRGSTLALSLGTNDVLGARAKANGSVEVYKNGLLVGTYNVTGWTNYARTGQVGLWVNAGSRLFDDFGGGTTSCS
jgi:hypothetical protein